MKLNNISLLLGIIWVVVAVMFLLPYKWSNYFGFSVAVFFAITYIAGYINGKKE